MALAAILLAALAVWYGAFWTIWSHHFRAAELPLRLGRICRRRPASRMVPLGVAERPGNVGRLLAARRRAGKLEQSAAWLKEAGQAGARLRDLRLERLLGAAQQGLTPELEGLLQNQLNATRTDYALIAEVLTAEYMRLYRLPDARAILNRWIELDADDVEPWVRRAWVAEHQLDFDAAVADYRHVLDMEPDRHPVRLRVAEILFKVRKPAEAIPELERLIAAQPADVAAALTLSRCRRELGQFEEASTALNGLPESLRKEARVRAERGLIAVAQNQFDDAESLLRDALRDLPRT